MSITWHPGTDRPLAHERVIAVTDSGDVVECVWGEELRAWVNPKSHQLQVFVVTAWCRKADIIAAYEEAKQ